MLIEYPRQEQYPQLRKLWELAFGDTEDFLKIFFDTAFSPDRCRCVTEGECVAAVLYWFDGEWDGQKLAYLYAVATHPEFRNRGLCRALMADTHALLKERGYDGVLLVPQKEGLRNMYGAMGYRDCTRVAERFFTAGEEDVSVRAVSREEYALLRRLHLPEGGVRQEGENLRLLDSIAGFYAGEDFLLAAGKQDEALWGLELLGNVEKAPGILKALGYPCGTFRMPGRDKPFAMFLPLKENAREPEYFGLAFD